MVCGGWSVGKPPALFSLAKMAARRLQLPQCFLSRLRVSKALPRGLATVKFALAPLPLAQMLAAPRL